MLENQNSSEEDSVTKNESKTASFHKTGDGQDRSCEWPGKLSDGGGKVGPLMGAGALSAHSYTSMGGNCKNNSAALGDAGLWNEGQLYCTLATPLQGTG